MREWDPLTASSAEIESFLTVFNAANAVDVPEDPPWQSDFLRGYLGETMPGERRICWIAEAEPGHPLGYTTVLLLGDIGVLELVVAPEVRGRNVGRALVDTVARRVYREGLSSLGVEVVGATPAVRFFEGLGFRCAYVETRALLQLGEVDWSALGEMANGIGAGYRVESFPGGPPDELIEAYAMAKRELRDADDGDLDLRPSSYEPQRLRHSLDTLHRRGLKPYIVVALHEESGAIAGLTEVVVPAQRPTRADQYDTVVVPAHQGNGVERAIKARMLFELRAAEPRLTEVQTWYAQESEPMFKVNSELGFRNDREWREYEADVADLVDRLASTTTDPG